MMKAIRMIVILIIIMEWMIIGTRLWTREVRTRERDNIGGLVGATIRSNNSKLFSVLINIIVAIITPPPMHIVLQYGRGQ